MPAAKLPCSWRARCSTFHPSRIRHLGCIKVILDSEKESVWENWYECSGSICKSRALVCGLEELVSKLGCCCARSSLCLPGSTGLFPRLSGNSHPPCFATSASQACCKQSSLYCSLYHLGKTWFALVHLWWDVVVARHNGHCTAVDLSKDVSVWAKAMCRVWGEKCAGLLPLAFATGMKWKHLWWSLTQIVVSSGEIAWN